MSAEEDTTTEVGGIEVNWTHFITGDDDPTVGNVSVLSSPAEWHALGVSAFFTAVAVATATPELLSGLLLYGLGRGTKEKAKGGHLKDVAREAAYSAVGALIGLPVGVALTAVF